MPNKISIILNWCKTKSSTFWTWYKGLYNGRPWYMKASAIIGTFFVSLFLYLGAVDLNLFWLFGKSPGYFSGIMEAQNSTASEIYSADSVMIGKYFNENRTPVEFQEVNPAFWKALIDTEDERFFTHWGVDPIGIFGAAKDAVIGGDARGASTITQQLAKNIFKMRKQSSSKGLLGYIPGVKMLIVKSKEWIIATKLEIGGMFKHGFDRTASKREILTMYANTVDFGSNAFGIKTACKTYFNTTPANITAEQAAVLVGMLKATTYYNPISHPENSLKRRNVVLSNMVSHGDLTKAEYDSLSIIPIKLDYKVENNYDGQAQYFREAVANYLQSWCEENGYDLYSSGLKIYTTIDTRMQKYAEAAATKQMRQVQQNFKAHWQGRDPWVDENGQVIPHFIEDIAKRQPFYKTLAAKFPNNPDSIDYYLNKPHKVKLFDYEKGYIEDSISTLDSIRYMVRFMHCAMVAMEPQTGAVKAWVGDIDFGTWKYDKATAMRQPGSTFKLFVYTEAMNQGLTPCDKRRDEYISMQVYDKKKGEMTTWTPHNANGSFSGDSMALKSAFARSINSVAVRLGQEMGIKRIIETAHKMGIESPLDDTPSLALGSSDVNLLELVNAYSTIAADGMHHKPVLVTRIVDQEGNEVYTGPTEEEQVIPYKSAFLMQQMLMAGTHDGGGTSISFSAAVYGGKFFNDTDWGGKTGTSNNHSDAWFMAVSPNLVVGAWVGGEYRSIHFRTGALGQGSKTALPICGYFVNSLLSDPAFEKYHGKWGRPKDESITADMYTCSGWYPRADSDTIVSDSLMHTEEITLDENGNPVSHPSELGDGTAPTSRERQGETPAATQPKKKKSEEVNFDDL